MTYFTNRVVGKLTTRGLVSRNARAMRKHRRLAFVDIGNGFVPISAADPRMRRPYARRAAGSMLEQEFLVMCEKHCGYPVDGTITRKLAVEEQ
jgi:hypothetical protein